MIKNKKRKINSAYKKKKPLGVWSIGLIFLLACGGSLYFGLYVENNYIGNMQDWLISMGVSEGDGHQTTTRTNVPPVNSTVPSINFNN